MKTKFEYLPKEIIKSTELTPSEKIIYLHLFHISAWKDEKIINKSQIAEKLGIKDRKTVINAFKKFEFLEIIKVNEDNTFELYINGLKFNNRSILKSPTLNEMLGHFIKVPTQFLYDTNLTPAERLVEMVLFDFYFIIDIKGNFVNKSNIKFQTIATIYNMSEKTINEHLRNIKAKGAIDYTVHTSNGKSKVYGFKFFKQETITVYNNGKSVITNEGSKVETKETTIEPEEELIPSNDIIETLTDDEVEDIISKCDTQINTNKTLRSLSEGQYNYFLASLREKDNLPLSLRRYR